MSASIGGCPCCYITPCHERCTCVEPFSSRGCARCCAYGSLGQRTSAANRLAAYERLVEAAKAWAALERESRQTDADLNARLARGETVTINVGGYTPNRDDALLRALASLDTEQAK